MMSLLTLVVAVLVVTSIAVAIRRQMRGAASKRYRTRAFLTGNEIAFFAVLREALPRHHIFPQVAMGGIMEPIARRNARSPEERRQFFSQWASIRSSRIDYCVCDDKFNVVCLVELDDSSHDTKRAADKERDARCAEAGYPTARFRREHGKLPSAGTVRAAVSALLTR